MTAGAAEANGGRSLEHAMSEVDLGFANDALPVSGSPGGSMRGGAKCARFDHAIPSADPSLDCDKAWRAYCRALFPE